MSRSGFSAWLERPRSQRSLDDERLGRLARQSFLDSDRTYGSRRVWRDVLATGERCGLHRVERLMQAQALRARPRRRGLPVDRGERALAAPAGNVLDRQFEAAGPNQKWLADFTYLWTAKGWLYVAVVLDLYSRRAVGWSIQASMTTQSVTDALMMAIWRRGKPDAPLFRPRQPVHQRAVPAPAGRAWRDLSMSRSGNVWDNSAMESFSSTLKTERTARKTYRTRSDAKADVFDYIERFYNTRRRHSTIGYVSPAQFEEQMQLA